MDRVCACGCGEVLRRHVNGRWPTFVRGHHLVGRLQDLRGKTYSMLTVVGSPQRRGSRTVYECLCQCGAKTTVEQSSLKGGHTKSCGCLQAIGYHTTHGMSNTPTYGSWMSMKARCYRESSTSYSRYGALGIRVTRAWLRFENFFRDMGTRPEGMSLERRDSTKGYYKGNCTWATPLEQSNNQKRTRYVEIEGERLSFANAVRKYGKVSYYVAKNRVNRDGWSELDSILLPPKGHK